MWWCSSSLQEQPSVFVVNLYWIIPDQFHLETQRDISSPQSLVMPLNSISELPSICHRAAPAALLFLSVPLARASVLVFFFSSVILEQRLSSSIPKWFTLLYSFARAGLNNVMQTGWLKPQKKNIFL